MDDGEFAAVKFAQWALEHLVDDRSYFEVPTPASPTMPCVELPTSSTTSNGKYTTINVGWVVLGSTKLQASQVALELADAIDDEHGYPVDVGHGYTVIGGGNAVVTPIPGTTGIKRYSVTGFLELVKGA